MKFPEIRSADLRKVRSYCADLSKLSQWEELIECSLQHFRSILPCDCICWNEWSPDLSVLRNAVSHDSYDHELTSRFEHLTHTVQCHPLIAHDRMQLTKAVPQRLSDHESTGRFRSNPLYAEVYRHLDADHQIAYTGAVNPHTAVAITANRKNTDFSNRHVQLQQIACDSMEAVVNALTITRIQETAYAELCQTLETATGLKRLSTLTPRESRYLNALATGQSSSKIAVSMKTRSDEARKLAFSIREKLGIGSLRELLSALQSTRKN